MLKSHNLSMWYKWVYGLLGDFPENTYYLDKIVSIKKQMNKLEYWSYYEYY